MSVLDAFSGKHVSSHLTLWQQIGIVNHVIKKTPHKRYNDITVLVLGKLIKTSEFVVEIMDCYFIKIKLN